MFKMSKKRLGLACVVLLVVMLIAGGCAREEAVPPENDVQVEPEVCNLEKSLAVDVAGFRSSDGQPLFIETVRRELPARPDDPEALPREDAGHWYDLEFAGWAEVAKVNIPESPADGAIGKRVITIINGDHPYLTAFAAGMQQIADAFDMDLRVKSPNWCIDMQTRMVDDAIAARPDMIILVPLDAKVAVTQFRRINEAGIPVIGSNMLPEDIAMRYVIGWTGPDDWGQMRLLAHKFAELMNYEGGFAVVQHAPGGSPYFARTYGIITELAKIAPDMKVLDKKAPGFEAKATMAVTADWITRFGDDLRGIVVSDDSAQMIGVNEAIAAAGREDIIRVAAGNSKVGMGAVEDGTLHAITFQTAEGDGAIALMMAVDWFNGKEIYPTIRHLPVHVITADDVEDFMPAQW